MIVRSEGVFVVFLIVAFALIAWAGHKGTERERERFADECEHAKGQAIERPSGRLVCYRADGSMIEFRQ